MSAATPSPTSAAASRAPQGAVVRLRGERAAARTMSGWIHRSGLRRLVASFLMALFALSCGESLLADVCDGDELATAVASDPGSAVPIAQGAAQARQGGEWKLVAHVDDSTSEHTPAPDRPHGVHVCHCTHAHNGLLSLRVAVDAAIVPVTEARLAHSDRLPPSPALEPQLRPPAVLQVA